MNTKKIAVGSGLVAVGSQAFAALPTVASDAITSVQTNVGDLITALWPVAVAVTVGFALIGLFKKGVSKVL